MYDVIVVGAGPTGSTAAKVLAGNGYKVLLAEKFKLPRYKSCSGQLIKKTLDLVQMYFGEAVPASTMCTPTENRGMVFTNDKGEEYRLEQPDLSEYDAWFNVKDGHLVLGISVKDTSKIDHYYQNFIAYMREHHRLHIEKQIKTDKWLMPHILPSCNIDYGVGRVLFAGEIAGFLNPMGEGISARMESGYFAAQAIMQHFDDLEMIYADYKERTKSLHNYMKRQWSFVAGIADTFSDMKL